MDITVSRMSDETSDIRGEAAAVFVDAYFKELSMLTKNKGRWNEALRHAFRGEAFFVARVNGRVMGILACSDVRLRGMHVDKRVLRKKLGFIKGSLAYSALSRELNKPLSYPEDTAYIECVGTMEEARAKGSAPHCSCISCSRCRIGIISWKYWIRTRMPFAYIQNWDSPSLNEKKSRLPK